MPEDKGSEVVAEQPGTDNQDEKKGGVLESAMEEAMAAVEARERGDDPEEESVEIEVESAPPDAPPEPAPPKDASTAIMEAMIKAKGELEEVLDQTQKEAASIREKWLRSAADLQNYKKRAAKERTEVTKFGNEQLLKSLLPVLDDLERTIEVVSTAEDGTLEQLLEGVQLVRKKFISQLERTGATTFESVGEAFDPARHDAVQQVHSELPPGTVADQLQRGFLLNERLLRPAMVTVSLGPETKAEDKGEPAEDVKNDVAEEENESDNPTVDEQ